jgi:hypothetical protein
MIDGIGVSFLLLPCGPTTGKVGTPGRMWLLALVPQESETVYHQPWVIKPLSVSARQRAPSLKRAGDCGDEVSDAARGLNMPGALRWTVHNLINCC